MKVKVSWAELPNGKQNQQGTTLGSTPKTLILVTLTLITLTLVPLYYPLNKYPSTHPHDEAIAIANKYHECDIFSGQWIRNPDAPYYNNMTCWAIHDDQNCQKFGRPDSDFMKWRWKPDGCDLPVFDPNEFLEIVRDKSLAFVGDSLGRNQMQSLICMLSRVEFPMFISATKDEHFKQWYYVSYNFTLVYYWSPFLVKTEEASADGPNHTGLFNLYLDEFDEKWATQIDRFNYLIINAGHWFWRSSFYYTNHEVIGCSYCHRENITNYPAKFGYRKALRTAFKAINSRENFKGMTILRTFAPMHFEGGEWNKGGDCVRKMPFNSNDITLEGNNLEFYMTQIEEFTKGENIGKKKGLKYRLLDITKAMLLRPDGHPSRYGHWPNENVTLYNDCVHWCLPGPIDTWSDFLLHTLKMESLRSVEEKTHPRG